MREQTPEPCGAIEEVNTPSDHLRDTASEALSSIVVQVFLPLPLPCSSNIRSLYPATELRSSLLTGLPRSEREVGFRLYAVRDHADGCGVLHGAVEPFNGKNWSSWIQRLTFYFVANDVSNEAKKSALLLTLCGTDTFETACALVAPKTPEEVSYQNLVTLLQKHFDSRPSELYSRCVFERRDQLPEESISSYVAALGGLTADCNFGGLTTTSATSPPPAEGHTPVLTNPTMLP
ncbi:hypothetical protein V5799_023413 [Amblyomma americanum]|uniref:Retrotransposon gag domain-containing protein n=1 Tax=Amblyomma americanum TaxID=6943 RepID=A0AAQ4FJR4_AMBAM